MLIFLYIPCCYYYFIDKAKFAKYSFAKYSMRLKDKNQIKELRL